MKTNIIGFEKKYLIEFLKFQVKNNTKLLKYYTDWLELNTTSFPDYYNSNHSKNLSDKQIVLNLPNTDNSYLSLKNQKKFEKIVYRSFKVVVFNNMFFNHYQKPVVKSIFDILIKYNIDFKHFDAIRKEYYRIRNDRKMQK